MKLLKTERYSLRDVQNITGVPRSIVGELKELLQGGDVAKLDKKPNGFKKCQNTVITKEDDTMIVDTLFLQSLVCLHLK